MYIYIYVIFHHVNHEKNIFFHWIKVKMQFILYNIYILYLSYVCSLKGVHEMTTWHWERGLPVIQIRLPQNAKSKMQKKRISMAAHNKSSFTKFPRTIPTFFFFYFWIKKFNKCILKGKRSFSPVNTLFDYVMKRKLLTLNFGL